MAISMTFLMVQWGIFSIGVRIAAMDCWFAKLGFPGILPTYAVDEHYFLTS